MGLTYTSFSIRGIDVSTHNGVIDWTKVNCNFAAIRVGYGRVIDTQFVRNWRQAKGKVKRIRYWYMDYYSNHIQGTPVYGMSDEAWGKEQAANCHNIEKGDQEGIVFLDIESTTGGYAPKIDEVPTRVQRIAKAFLIEIDKLNGKKNGLYNAVGWLDWYEDWFRDRPLWVAWYPFRSFTPTADDVIEWVKNQGWKTKPLFWQYASDGDVDDNGTSDGRSMGMESVALDLNGWIATQADYLVLFGTQNPPDDEVIVIPPVVTMRTIEVKKTLSRLNMRSSPKIGWNVIKTLPVGKELDCLETIIDGKNIWQRVGVDQYVAEYHDGKLYLK
ncbi:MAG: GH25 family lysozyme [Dehalococcoidia bacterium]|jgi:GH25 family lysozyme M1 (1,4-beta-N-acetylmuramidase)